VKLSGDKLHSESNSIYVHHSQLPLDAKMMDGNEIAVKITGTHIFDPKTVANINGIGFLGLHSESDYEPDEKEMFCSYYEGCGLVDIGRYGPFLKEDRKTELNFNIKNFIFANEPAGWNFGVEEKIREHNQIVDVTDDATGDPHGLTKSNIPMYVNEVGHNKDLEQNVLAQEVDDRTVHYFLHLDKPMKKGETTELLVDYLDGYERTRERKGYGKANIESGLQSDECDAARILRNYKEREDIEETIASMSEDDMQTCMHFIKTRILNPVLRSTNAFIRSWENRMGRSDHAKVLTPPPRQWVARRRMHWLKERLEVRVGILRRSVTEAKIGSARLVWDVAETEDVLLKMEWDSMYQILPFMDKVFVNGNRLVSVMVEEISEELLFATSKQLPKPFDHSHWCPISTKLLRETLHCIAASILCKTDDIVDLHTKMVQSVMNLAKSAGEAVVKACDNLNSSALRSYDSAENLCFRSPDHEEISMFESGMKSELKVDRNHVVWEKLTDGHLGLENAMLGKGTYFVMTEYALAGHRQSEPCRPFTVARSLESFVKGSAKVNKNWYLVHQVIKVVHALTSTYIESKTTNRDAKADLYSLGKLCSVVGIAEADAKCMMGLEVIASVQPTPCNVNDPKEKASGIDEADAKHMMGLKVNTSVQPNPCKVNDPKRKASDDPIEGKNTQFFKKHASSLFWLVIWSSLENLGWKIEVSPRGKDKYYLPPGVTRKGFGFKNRVDFFDSIPQVLNVLKFDQRWNNVREIVKTLDHYKECLTLLQEVRLNRNKPDGFSPEWLVKEVERKKYDKSCHKCEEILE